MNKPIFQKGAITIYIIIFSGIFIILFGSFLNFIIVQHRVVEEKISWNESLNIAEAGMNYYRWCINNDVEEDCFTEKDYFDPFGNLLGKFQLQASSTAICGQDIKKDIVVTGWTNKFPQVQRKVAVLYARTSVA